VVIAEHSDKMYVHGMHICGGLESLFEAMIALELCKASYFQDDIGRLFSNQRRDNVIKVD
jgi:hypothetical protein